jgi:hypothetical protein
MKYTRLYTGPDGLSHFQDVEIGLSSAKGGQNLSQLIKATGVIFRETGAGYDYDWHNPSRRQFVVNLDGAVDVVASDGTTRRFGPGEIFLAEDITGKGHISRAVNNQPRKSLFITLD